MIEKNKFFCFLVLLLLIFITNNLQADECKKIKLNNGTLWVSSSDEYKLCACQAYENATVSLEKMVKDKKPANWCVVMDIDDTILNTVNHIIGLEERGEKYSDEEWIEWYKKNEALPVPGAVEFTQTVKKLGGKVILITNTQPQLRELTLNNLKTFGFNYDMCLMKTGSYARDTDKVLRVKDVADGNIKGYPEYGNTGPQNILMRIGDSAHDLYDTTKYKFEDVKDRIGKDLIIIPNPMYGSWSHSQDDCMEPITSVTEGKEFTITLDSNPSTGYKWELQKLDETMVTLISCKYAKKDNLLPGSGGKEIWTLKGISKGKTVISFRYARPWEKDEESWEEKSFFILIK